MLRIEAFRQHFLGSLLITFCERKYRLSHLTIFNPWQSFYFLGFQGQLSSLGQLNFVLERLVGKFVSRFDVFVQGIYGVFLIFYLN